jgi:phage gpG-like protein
LKGFSIELDGFQEVLTKLAKEGGKIAQEIDDEIAAGVRNMEKSAKRLAPVDTGRLRGSITTSRNAFLNWELVAHTNYAPYIEFGTGGLVDVPKGLEQYAIQFKGKGIRQVNLPARPFFFPSVFAYQVEIVKNIREIIRREKRI